MRCAEGMGATAIGPVHRATTYTGVRGPEQPKGKGRRRERDRLRGQALAQELARRTAYTASDAPGDPQEVTDPTGLMGVKSTNSLGRDAVKGSLIPLSLVVVMGSHLNQPGNLM